MEDQEAKQSFENFEKEDQKRVEERLGIPYDDAKKLAQHQNRRLFTPVDIHEHWDNVKRFYELTPYFYDKSGLFWIWDEAGTKWVLSDDIDIIIKLENQLGLMGRLSTHGLKTKYLDSLKKWGRQHLPKPAPSKWVQFKDKAFSLSSGEVYKVTPDYFFTNPIPWELGTKIETPTIDKLFSEWVGEDNKHILYEIIAYCCYTDYPLHYIFAFVGTGRNGKSQFQKLLAKFIGKDNICSTELDVLADNRFESFKLYKKLICSMGETNSGVLHKTSLIKRLSGQDLIGYEAKNKQPFDDYNYAKIIINTNSLPTTMDNSDGWYRRWVIIQFPNEFQEGKDVIASIPMEEFNNLALKCVKILKEILERGTFTSIGTIDQRREAYDLASNPFPKFFEETCEEDPGGYIRPSELYSKYLDYLKVIKRRKPSRFGFFKLLGEEGLEVYKTSKKIGDSWVSDRYIEGYRFKEVLGPLRPCDNSPTLYNSLLLRVEQKSQSHSLSQKTINDLKVYTSTYPLDNMEGAILHFGKEFIDKMLVEGEIYESPKGTIRILE